MIYGILAEFVLVLHLAFVVFVTLGGLLNFRWRRAWMVHLPALFWGFLVEFLYLECPLTSLENFLRLSAGQQGYARGFLDHLLSTILYPGLPPEVHILLGVCLAVINAGIYFMVLRRARPASYTAKRQI